MAGRSRVRYRLRFLRGRQNETVVKVFCMTSAAASETFRFKPPYKMADYGSIENGKKWIDGHIDYRELHTVLNEAVAGFGHLYGCGVSKCTFLAGLTGRPFNNQRMSIAPRQTFSIPSALYPALPQVSKIILRNQIRAFPLRLVDVLSAEEGFRPMPTRYVTSYCRFCCSPTNQPCTSPSQTLYNGN